MNNKLKLGKIDIKTVISEIDLILPTEISLQIEAELDKVIILAESLIDLTELQEKFFLILKNTPLPSRSNDYGVQAVIDSIDSATLKASGDICILETSLSASVWEIVKGIPTPVPRWKQVCIDVPFIGRMCTDIPDGLDWVNGSDIIIKLFSEGASAKVEFGLTTPEGKSINIKEFNTEVSPRGDLGKFIATLLELVKVNLNTLAKKEIQGIINEGSLKQTLPKNIDMYDPIIKTIQFTTLNQGQLGAFVSFEACLTEDQLAEIISKSIG
jgi:hypothetical protein